MNKTEMARYLAKETGIPVAKAGDCLTAIFDGNNGMIAKELADPTGRVQISGFGTFSTKHRDARTGRNPQTGDPMDIPARYYAHFSAGKTLKERIGDN